MLLTISDFLSHDEVSGCREALHTAPWVDGRVNAGSLSSHVKDNEQVDTESTVARTLANQLLRKLGSNPLFLSAAMPHAIQPPRFNRYRGGQAFGIHVDGAIMPIAGTDRVMRSDLSATLFLTEPQDYDGGELTIETAFGAQEVKLRAGDLVLYPSSSLHRVQPVTRGERVCAFFWVQSMIRGDRERSLLFDLDQTIQSIGKTKAPTDPDLVQLTAVYYNLVRLWATV
jgi:PKHD-type hydroxylase